MIQGYKIAFPGWEIDSMLDKHGRLLHIQMRSDILPSCVYRFQMDYFKSQLEYSKSIKVECAKRLSEAERYLKLCMIIQANESVL